MHYGVKGMKWGVRRYRNADGTLTKEGKRKAKQAYKEDNKTAYELGRRGTIYGRATAKSMNRTIKLENKLDKQYAKDPDGVNRKTQSLMKKWNASSKTTMELAKEYYETRDFAEAHCNSLIKKYGKEAVSDIKYKDVKLRKGTYSPKTFETMNEKTNKLSDYAIAGAATAASAAMTALMRVPVSMIFKPESTGTNASRVENDAYRRNLKS